MEFSDQQLVTVAKALSKNHFLELLVAFFLRDGENDPKWHVKPLSQYLKISHEKTYELLREASRLGLLKMEKAKVPTPTGDQKVKVFMRSDHQLNFGLLRGGNDVLYIKVGKEAQVRTFENIRTLFSILGSKPFMISCKSIRSTQVYFTLKKLQEEWKRNGFPNLRGSWYTQVLKPLEELHPELCPLEKLVHLRKNAIFLRENSIRRRPPIYYRFRYSRVILEFNQDLLPSQFEIQANGVVTPTTSAWSLFKKNLKGRP